MRLSSSGGERIGWYIRFLAGLGADELKGRREQRRIIVDARGALRGCESWENRVVLFIVNACAQGGGIQKRSKREKLI